MGKPKTALELLPLVDCAPSPAGEIMGRLKLKKPPMPILSRLQRAENAFRQAVLEHTAWGQKMVVARTEFLEANAEERAKLALQYPDDKLIQTKSLESTEELLAWYKKIGSVTPVISD